MFLNFYKIKYKTIDTTNDIINYNYEYVYSSNGNITSKTEYKIQNNISTKCKEYLYTYSNNMLTEEEVRDYTINTQNYTITLQTNYQYDNISNIISILRTVKKNEYSSLPSQIYYYYEDIKGPTKLTKYVIDSFEFTTTYKSDGTPLLLCL